MSQDKRIGRPPLDPRSPSAAVNLKLPTPLYNAAAKVAARGENIQDVIRRGLRKLIADEMGKKGI